MTRSAATPVWIDVGASAKIRPNEVISFDQGDQTLPSTGWPTGAFMPPTACAPIATLQRTGDRRTDRVPKHNGRFDIVTGRAVTRPATVDLMTYQARNVDGRIRIRIRGF